MLGGPSAEREISLRSGAAAVKALKSLGHQVSEVDPQKPGWKLPPKVDVVFLALHGTYGEDGTVQKELEALKVPFTGCDSEASRIAFDKILTKECCTKAHVPNARYQVITSHLAHWPRGWNPPVILKPVCQGSSVGLQIVERIQDFSSSLTESFRYDKRVLMEEKIEGRETTVGILGDEALPVVEIQVKKGMNDYGNKYTAGAADHFCPADFDAATTKRIQDAALGAFRAIGGRDYARVDVMVKANGDPVVLEVNTLPGMTELSLLPMAAAAAGLNFAQLCQRMVDLALKR